MSAPLDDEFREPPPPAPQDAPEVKLRRSGPDPRWPESRWRWYVYLDDEVTGYLDAMPVRHRPVKWLPKAMSGSRAGHPDSLYRARDQLLRHFLWVPDYVMFECPVCGHRRPRRGPGRVGHFEGCPLEVAGLFDLTVPKG